MASPILDPSWHRVVDLRPDRPSATTLIAEGLLQDAEAEAPREPSEGNDEAMADEDEGEWEYEDEEEIITLDIGDLAVLGSYITSAESYSVSGLETSEPYLRMGNITFRGMWDELNGSLILLKDEREGRERTMRPFASSGPARSNPSTQRILFRPVVPVEADAQDSKEGNLPSRPASQRGATKPIGKPRGKKPMTDEERVHSGVIDALRALYVEPGPFELGKAGVVARTSSAGNTTASAQVGDQPVEAEGSLTPAHRGRGRGGRPRTVRGARGGRGGALTASPEHDIAEETLSPAAEGNELEPAPRGAPRGRPRGRGRGRGRGAAA